jgi:hypothetical protein
MNHDIQRSRKVLEPPHATGQLSQWLHAGLKPAGFDAILLETRHVKAALSAMTVKTDRNDARGLAQLIRMGRFRPVHAARCRAKGSKATSSIPRRLRGPAGADGRRLTRSMERESLVRALLAYKRGETLGVRHGSSTDSTRGESPPFLKPSVLSHKC